MNRKKPRKRCEMDMVVEWLAGECQDADEDLDSLEAAVVERLRRLGRQTLQKLAEQKKGLSRRQTSMRLRSAGSICGVSGQDGADDGGGREGSTGVLSLSVLQERAASLRPAKWNSKPLAA